MSAKKLILVVDDEEAFAKIVRASLDEDAYEVQAASDGLKGLSLIAKNMPDVILLDMRMPNMNGIEFLTELKSTYGEGVPPVIVTTNDASLDKISDSVQLGVRTYIVKSDESMQGIKQSIEKVLQG